MKIRTRLFLVSLLVCIVTGVMLSGCQAAEDIEITSAQTSLTEPVSLTVTGNGYSLDMGQDWTLADGTYESEDNSAEHTFVLSEPKNELDASTTILFQTVSPAGYDTSEQFGKHLSLLYEEQSTDVISQGKCFVNGYEAYEIVLKMPLGDELESMKARHVVLIENGCLYSFMLAAYPQHYDANTEKMNTMLDTFSVSGD